MARTLPHYKRRDELPKSAAQFWKKVEIVGKAGKNRSFQHFGGRYYGSLGKLPAAGDGDAAGTAATTIRTAIVVIDVEIPRQGYEVVKLMLTIRT